MSVEMQMLLTMVISVVVCTVLFVLGVMFKLGKLNTKGEKL